MWKFQRCETKLKTSDLISVSFCELICLNDSPPATPFCWYPADINCWIVEWKTPMVFLYSARSLACSSFTLTKFSTFTKTPVIISFVILLSATTGWTRMVNRSVVPTNMISALPKFTLWNCVFRTKLNIGQQNLKLAKVWKSWTDSLRQPDQRKPLP